MNPKDLSLVNDFAKTAKAYCDLIDGYRLKTRSEFICSAFLLITDLLNKAMQLPRITDLQDEERPTAENSNEKFDRFKALTEFLGDWCWYQEVFDGISLKDSGNEVGTADLADDFTDIYKDLREGLESFDLGTPKNIEEAVWQWKFLFEMHWGRHATSALRAIYLRVPRGEI